ncbi:START domain-containing protein 10-like [Corticium candelabrum]|uniref:START domain-containing protein 10-like n=1 Tax=Corticium candelabrum TaxID=121492 RepID=UPI002E37583B|nr:START domain-containing protein 10-like [Corticium candelabrum]
MNRKLVFQDKDFQRAFELEAGREDDGWTKTGTWTESSEFWKMVDYDAAVPLHLKCRIRVNDVPLEKCRKLLTNVELRNKWDGAKFEVNQLERNPYYSTIYWIFHLPFFVQNRDMVQHTAVRWIPEKKAYVILYKDGTHPSKPETNDYIRMKTGLSYTILRRADNDPNTTIMSTLGNNEYGGWLPYALMGKLYASSLTKLSQRLTKACSDYSEESTSLQKPIQKQTPSLGVAASRQYHRSLSVKDQR